MVGNRNDHPGPNLLCLVEGNPLAARYLRRLLEETTGARVLFYPDVLVGARPAASAPEAFLIDAGTLDEPLSRFLRSLHTLFPHARILLLDHPLPDAELCRLLFLGVQGFLPYEDIEARLPEALQAVLQGRLWVTPAVLRQYHRLADRLSRLREKRGAALTAREQRILDLVRRRLSNKEISSILSIGESTVKFHLGNIFAKLGVHDREAVREVAEARGLDDLQPEKSD